MTGEHAPYLELCAGYVLGSLDDADQEALEEHLAAGCPTCDRALAEYGECMVGLALTIPPVEPDPIVLDRLMEAVDDEPVDLESARQTRREVPRAASRRLVSVLGWAAAAGLAFMLWLQSTDLGEARGEAQDLRARQERTEIVLDEAQRALTELRGQVDANRTELDALRVEREALTEALAEERAWADAMAAPRGRAIRLTATGAGAEDISGWAFHDVDSGRLVLVLEHVQAPDEGDLELWAIRESGPQSLGVIEVGDDRSMVRADTDERDPLTALAVSIERPGGSPDPSAPQGPVILMGAF